MQLSNKRILFIAPSFFGYEKAILTWFIKKHAEVTYVPLEKHSILFQYLFRGKYADYDYLFVIKGYGLSISEIKSFIEVNPSAKRILYLYDSLDRYPLDQEFLSLFDRVFSFDNKDCNSFNLIFRPLFFIEEYRIKSEEIKYEISSVSSYYPKRLQVFKRIKNTFQNEQLYLRLYIDWKKLIIHNLLLYTKNFNMFSFIPLEASRVASIFSHSKAVLDVTHEMQTGLTIRTIETLAMKKKLITTNQEINKYDFYHPNNIFILKENYDEIYDFLKLPYYEIHPKILQKYTIDRFIEEIFS